MLLMAKSPTRSESKSVPRSRKKAKGKRKRQSFVEHNRRQIVLGGMILVIAATAVAIYRSTATTDATKGRGGFTGDDFHSLVADPSKPNRLVVGGHEGVAVSEDGGRNWQEIESLENADAMGWGFDEGAVYLGGHPGLRVSADGGKTFTERNEGLPETDIHSLGAGGGILYAGLPAGLAVSTDGGKSWRIQNRQAARSLMGRILVDPSDPKHLLAADMAEGVVETRDGGQSWKGLGGADGAHWISWDPSTTARIVTSGVGRFVESTDGGDTWSSIEVPVGTGLVEVNPHDPQMLYAGLHEGNRVSIMVSRDGGATWTRP